MDDLTKAKIETLENDITILKKRVEHIWKAVEQFQSMLRQHKDTKGAHDIGRGSLE